MRMAICSFCKLGVGIRYLPNNLPLTLQSVDYYPDDGEFEFV